MFYFDMDGVFTLYDESMFTGDKPPYKQLGSHTFAKCKPDPVMQRVIEKLSKVLKDDIYVLTAVSNDSVEIRNEQILDKMNWLKIHYPTINLCNFIACDSNKRDSITKIKGFHLSKADVLVDDFNRNLFAWVEVGGVSIKYLNGVNTIGIWPGPTISRLEDTDVEKCSDLLVEKLLNIWYENKMCA